MSGIRTGIRRFFNLANEVTRETHVRYRGSILPPKHMRLCSKEYGDDDYFVRSTEVEAERLVNQLGCNLTSRILDIGCGAGRLPIEILRKLGEVDYYGLDVLRDRIEWCNRFISRAHPSFHFGYLDVYSGRYHQSGQTVDENFRFPFPDNDFDIVYLYAVLPHLTVEETKTYLRETHRLLKPSGKAFVSTFVEEGVANPPGYLGLDLPGPLHIVVYERNFLVSIIEESRLKVDDIEKLGKEFHDRKTALYLSRSVKSPIAVRNGA